MGLKAHLEEGIDDAISEDMNTRVAARTDQLEADAFETVASEVQAIAKPGWIRNFIASNLKHAKDKASRGLLLEELQWAHNEVKDKMQDLADAPASLKEQTSRGIKAAVISPLQDLYSTVAEAVAKSNLDYQFAVGKKLLNEREQKFIERQCEETFKLKNRPQTVEDLMKSEAEMLSQHSVLYRDLESV